MIEFQTISWGAFDYGIEEDDDHKDCCKHDDKYLIKIYGTLRDGKTVSVSVTDFTPFFFIKLQFQVNHGTTENLYKFMYEKLPFKLKSSLIDVRILSKKDFWGFHADKQFFFARFKFKSLAGFRAGARVFMKPVCIPSIVYKSIQFKLYESNIEPFLRMMHIQDLQPCGWIRVPSNTINYDLYPTTCDINVTCKWKEVVPIKDEESIAPFSIASFDLECTSSHGDFPVPIKNYKKLAYELSHYYKDHCHDDLIKDKLVVEIINIFNHDVEGIFSKVFLKPQYKTPLVSLVQKHMDDIFAILGGKLNYKGNDKDNKPTILEDLIKKFGDVGEYGDWSGIFPPLEGDSIIQIGTTVHRYGELECSQKYILTLGTCEPLDDGVVTIPCETEAELLLKWRDLIVKTIDPDIITGYNIFGFDMSYLWHRAQECGIEDEISQLGRICDKQCKYVEKELSSSALGDNLLKYIDMDGRVLIDIMKVVQRDHKLDSYKLDNVANHFMKMNKNDIHPSDIFRLQKGDEKDRKVIAQYCIQDCALCNHLTMKLEILANNIGMSNVCYVPLTYIFMRGQGVKIFSLVAKECRAENLVIPTIVPRDKDKDKENIELEDDESGFEGAIVLEPKVGIYIDDPVSILDYASLYPSSMISENLSHDSIVLESKYDNLPGYNYEDIVYDVYETVENEKVKTSEKKVRFVQSKEKGTIPKILMKLLKSRKETRKKMTLLKITYTCPIGKCKKFVKGTNVKLSEDKKTAKYNENESIESIDEIIVEDYYDEFQKAVLDGLQNAYKVTANSLYGQCGARTSPIYMKDIAACTTATGRKMILMAKKFLEDHFMAEIVYGDSVTSYTPVIIRHKDMIKIEKIENLGAKYGYDKWLMCFEEGKQDKEYCELYGVDSWTESGWTNLNRVIRHELVSTKNIIRITTNNGIVDVTDDHSLLKPNGTEVSPYELNIGDQLLHHDYPVLENINRYFTEGESQIMGFFCGVGSCKDDSWVLDCDNISILEKYRDLCQITYPTLDWNIIDMFKLVPSSRFSMDYGGVEHLIKKYKNLLYDENHKIVPCLILNSSVKIREAFWVGFYDTKMIIDNNQLSVATFNLLANSLGHRTSLDVSGDDYKMSLRSCVSSTDESTSIDESIQKKYNIGYSGYVYDLTTKNHHFQAGVGRLIVHNTDSIFCMFPNKDENGNILKGKDAIAASIKTSIEASKQFKQYLKAPHDLEYEKTFWPFILFSKKRYCANKYEYDDTKYKMSSMGIALKRRDNANIVKQIYGGVLNIILNEQDVKKSITFLKQSLKDLIGGKSPIEDLIITKSLKSDYKNPQLIAHKVLAERMGERDPGNKPQVNDRIPFIYICTKEKNALQGNRIEHPDYIQSKNLKPDYEFYITNQIMKPITQLYSLALDQLDGHKKITAQSCYAKVLKEKGGDIKKTKARYNDLMEAEVKRILFDPFLILLSNKRNGNTMITDYFK